MATKNNMKNKPKTKKDDSAVVYNVLIALLLLCAGILVLRSIHNYYITIEGMARLDPLRPYVLIAGILLCGGCTALYFLWKKPVSKFVMPWLIFIFAMVAVTAASMMMDYVYAFTMLYFIWAAILVQYIIYQLYRWEFFLFSLPTLAAGYLFYEFRNGFGLSTRSVLLLIVTGIILLAVAYLAYNASRNKGQLVVGKKRMRLFSRHYNPFLHYLVTALWFVCIVAALLLGDLFSFYCMFAAIAVEFIAAVYYTFQLN
ncbi:MAG: hypothetical protein J6J43_04860 [Oscillospiraceae bacterium]|nr:hypothetical protein [Oscillospiraceae bacterium]